MNKKIILLFFILFVFTGKDLLSAELYTVDLGTVAQDRIKEKVIPLINDFQEIFMIRDLTPGCKCIRGQVMTVNNQPVLLNKQLVTVPAGGTYSVRIWFDARGYHGRVQKKIYIYGEIKDQRRLVILNISAFVK